MRLLFVSTSLPQLQYKDQKRHIILKFSFILTHPNVDVLHLDSHLLLPFLGMGIDYRVEVFPCDN